MIRHILDSARWALALSALEQGRYLKALTLLKEITGRLSQKSEYQALTANCCLTLGKFYEAQIGFNSAIETARLTTSDKERYVELYARHWLSSMNRSSVETESLREAVINQPCPQIYRRWLPLS